jgi:lysophospholipase L1-like esterase
MSRNNTDKISAGKRFVFVLLTILIVVAAVIGASEIFFRSAGLFEPIVYKKSAIPGMIYEQKPGITYKVGEVVVRINSDGFRDREFSERKRAGVKRIVCLGDSMTIGVRLPSEQLYERILERKLKAAGNNVEFMNMGVGGYNTAQEWLVYEHEAKKFKPDMVIVQFTLNDLTAIHPVYMGNSVFGRLRVFLADHFRTYNFLKFVKRMSKEDFSADQGISLKETDPMSAPVSLDFMKRVYEPGGPFFRDWKAAAAKFGELNREGVPVVFVIFPWAIYIGMDEGKPYPYYVLQEQIESVLRSEGISYVDVTPEYAAGGNMRRFWAAKSDFHPNAEAYKLIADKLFPRVNEILNPDSAIGR